VNAQEGSRTSTRREALRERDREREQAVIARLSTLAGSLDGEPDPAFRAAARARLVAMAAVRTPGTPDVPVRPPVRARWRRRLTAALATVAVVTAALTALVALAGGSGPGDPLYGVKRGTEQTELALAGDVRRGPVLLDLAHTRLAELRALARGAAPDPALVRQTLTTMDAETTDAAAWFVARAVDRHSAAPLDQLSRWSNGQSSGLEALRGHLPAAVSPAVQHSLDLLSATQRRTDAVRSTVTPTPGSPAPGTTAGTGPTTSAPGAPSSPDAPTSVGNVPGAGTLSSTPGRSSGTAAVPTQGLPTLPSSGTSPGIGGLPSISLPSRSTPRSALPVPTLPAAPTPSAVCVGPITIGPC
jgi:hypothetical protein